MATILFTNNAQTTLAGPLTNIAVTANLATGSGALFPTVGAGQYFLLTFVDAATGLLREIVKVTARTGDAVTIVRAQEGTTALGWSAGDIAANLWTAGSAAAMAQSANISSTPFAVDSGAANAYIITPSPALGAYAQGVGYVVEFTAANTAASTINVSALGVKNIFLNGAALVGGEIGAGRIYQLAYDGTQFQLLNQVSPATNNRQGVIATASSAVTIAGTSTATAVTPAGLAAFPKAATTDNDYFEIPGTGYIFQAGTYVSLSNTVSGSELFTFPTPFLAGSRPRVTFGAMSTSGTTDTTSPSPPNGTLSVHKVALDKNTPPTATGFNFWVSAENETSDVFDGTITTFDWHAVGPRP